MLPRPMKTPVARIAPPPAASNVLETIGATPLVRLSQFESPGGPRLFAKCEFLGPGNAIFDRAALAQVEAAEKDGRLASAPGGIFAAGGTDAVVSLALVASAKGVPLTVVVPRSMHLDRRRALRDYGAKSIAVDESLGHDGACAKARELAAEREGLLLDLFGAESSSAYEAIGRELVEALGRAPALTVCGLDLGAIPTGISRGLGSARVLAVEPGSARIATEGKFGPHLLNGLAPAPLPIALDRDAVDALDAVDDRAAWAMAERLSREAGLLAGIVSGAVVEVALRQMDGLSSADSIVAVLPDSGERRFLLADFFA